MAIEIKRDLYGAELWKEIEKNRPKIRKLVKEDLDLNPKTPGEAFPLIPESQNQAALTSAGSYYYNIGPLYAKAIGEKKYRKADKTESKKETKKAKDLSNLKKAKREIIF